MPCTRVVYFITQLFNFRKERKMMIVMKTVRMKIVMKVIIQNLTKNHQMKKRLVRHIEHKKNYRYKNLPEHSR